MYGVDSPPYYCYRMFQNPQNSHKAGAARTRAHGFLAGSLPSLSKEGRLLRKGWPKSGQTQSFLLFRVPVIKLGVDERGSC